MARPYIPNAGDVVWISFNPQAGREQAGHRPAVVLSPAAYNAKTSLMVCCPMTTQIKGYPFEVVISGANPSAVLADQIKSVDWRRRRARRKGTISLIELAEVRAKIWALIG
jgi:mRNA interferase MazF